MLKEVRLWEGGRQFELIQLRPFEDTIFNMAFGRLMMYRFFLDECVDIDVIDAGLRLHPPRYPVCAKTFAE